MLRIVLLGRTGNNLFQYALGRVLSAKHGVPLVLDGSWFNGTGWSEVSHFLKLPLKAKVVRHFSIGSRALRRFTGKHYWEYCGVPILRESGDDQSFDSRFLNAPADCMLFGYFQSPRYFESIAGELRSELNGLIEGFLDPGQTDDPHRAQAVSTANPSLVDQLRMPNSVAVHVRRGDYLKNPVFQVCGEDYYHSAMNQMRDRLPGARFFVFSDDPVWCGNTFHDRDIELIDSGEAGKNPLHDLYLMSLASHHIIANSSYSWWAAWIGDKPDQQVIMPDRWYAHGIKAPMEEKRWK